MPAETGRAPSIFGLQLGVSQLMPSTGRGAEGYLSEAARGQKKFELEWDLTGVFEFGVNARTQSGEE